MMNGQFDIVYDASSGTVKNVQTGKSIYQFTGSGSLQSTDSITALMSAIGSQNIDDTFAMVTFFVSTPTVAVNSIGDIPQGENFNLNGTTSLAAGDNLMVDITSSSFSPTSKSTSYGFSGAGGMVTVMPGSAGQNTWSFTVDTSTFTPDEYPDNGQCGHPERNRLRKVHGGPGLILQQLRGDLSDPRPCLLQCNICRDNGRSFR